VPSSSPSGWAKLRGSTLHNLATATGVKPTPGVKSKACPPLASVPPPPPGNLSGVQAKEHASGKRWQYRNAAERDYYDYYEAVGALSER
jgi:hypothetical protein